MVLGFRGLGFRVFRVFTIKRARTDQALNP